jgi:hypothetical protein
MKDAEEKGEGAEEASRSRFRGVFFLPDVAEEGTSDRQRGERRGHSTRRRGDALRTLSATFHLKILLVNEFSQVVEVGKISCDRLV